jgi:hypothetical protein
MAAGEIVTLLVIIGCVWGLIQFTGLKAWHAARVLVAGFTSRCRRAHRRSARSCPASRIVRPLAPGRKEGTRGDYQAA